MKRLVALLSAFILTVSAFGQAPLNFLRLADVIADTTDSNAQAYFTPTGLSNTTYKYAVNHLVKDMKDSSLWSGTFPAVYMMAGGTAALHKWNLMDPRDLDAAYRITWTGTVTHTATGADPDGSTGYGDTHFNPNTALGNNLFGLGIYLTENTAAGDKEDMGSNGSSGSIDVAINVRFTGDAFYPAIGGSQFPSVANTSAIGDWFTNRVNTTQIEGYKNGVRVVNATQAQGRATNSIALFARAGDVSTFSRYSDRNCAFAWISSVGLTTTQARQWHNIIQRFQTNMGRANP